MPPEPSSEPAPASAPALVIVGAVILRVADQRSADAEVADRRAADAEAADVAVDVGEQRPGHLRVLAAQRSYPPRLAGQWEFPGGKVEPGETEPEALRRECREELAADVDVGPRMGPDLRLAEGVVLRIYLARLRPGAVVVAGGDHAQLRWLHAAELGAVPWLPADRPLLEPLAALLRSGSAGWLATAQESSEVNQLNRAEKLS